jgi:hypothetical protein
MTNIIKSVNRVSHIYSRAQSGQCRIVTISVTTSNELVFVPNSQRRTSGLRPAKSRVFRLSSIPSISGVREAKPSQFRSCADPTSQGNRQGPYQLRQADFL